jgi:hypothetical protein
MPLATVFYEDKQAAGVNNFGAHTLLLACVTDALGGDNHWALARLVEPNPRGGNSALRAALKEVSELLGPDNAFAMFDADHVRDCYQLHASSCLRAVLDAIAAESGLAHGRIVFLQANMETLLDACCDALGRQRPETKPRPQERDDILQAVANARDRGVRDKVRHAVPSFSRLCVRVACWVQSAQTAEPHGSAT